MSKKYVSTGAKIMLQVLLLITLSSIITLGLSYLKTRSNITSTTSDTLTSRTKDNTESIIDELNKKRAIKVC